jgi:hypothetical protein
VDGAVPCGGNQSAAAFDAPLDAADDEDDDEEMDDAGELSLLDELLLDPLFASEPLRLSVR